MSQQGSYIVLIAVTAFAIAIASANVVGGRSGKNGMDHYPLSWTELDFKAIIDNGRLFKKYKDCLTEKKPKGCPRDVLDVKKIIPEILDTLCTKCLPTHIEKFKEGASYFCQTRRDEYEEVRRTYDPDGSIQKRFEDHYGALNC